MVIDRSLGTTELGPTKRLTGVAAAGLGGAAILSGIVWAGIIALITMMLR